MLATDAWKAAWRSTLRVAFEEMARVQRSNAQRAGHQPPEDDSAEVVIVGTLNTDASPASGGVLLSVRVQWMGDVGPSDREHDRAVNPVDGGVILTVVGSLAADRMGEWRAGRTVRAPAVLRRPSRYLDPGVPDHERELARRGVALVGTVKSGALVEVLASGSAAAETAARIRSFARRAIQSSVGRWNARSAGIVTAIVIGDRTGLDDEVERRLQEAGTYHVIAISGGNIAILVGLTLAVFRVAGLLGRAAMLSAMAGLIAYAYLVGGGASVDRATLMAVVYLAGRILDLRGSPLNTLAVVAAILVLGNPLAVSEPAFLLTFGATAAILAVAPAVSVERLPKVLAGAVSILAASVATEAALIPVAATVFSRVTFAGLVLNFAAIPLMAVAQIAGMAAVALSLGSERVAAIVGWVAHVGAEGLVWTAGLVEFAPALTWRVAKPAASAVAVYYAGLIVGWLAWRRRAVVPAGAASARLRSLGFLSAMVAGGAAVWILVEPAMILRARGDGRLHVTFIDVGQGDSSLVRFPHGDTLVVDAGGLGGKSAFDVGDRVVAPLLREAGVRRIGTLALTHGDADHIGGALSLIHEFRPWEIWEGIPVPRSEPLQALRASARGGGSRWATVQAADLVGIDEVDVVVRHPGLPDWERQSVRNNDSIVLELRWRDVSVVLAGDIGREAEQAIASRFAPSPLRVVKVPHHGSLTSSSSEFVRALGPRIAVVSVGRGNRFGHPAPAVLQRYGAIGAEIFRTDRDGAVTIDTDGTSLDVSTFGGRHLHLASQVAGGTAPQGSQVARP
jgi:competence protein ComEC